MRARKSDEHVSAVQAAGLALTLQHALVAMHCPLHDL
jgi:hypothetical protein